MPTPQIASATHGSLRGAAAGGLVISALSVGVIASDRFLPDAVVGGDAAAFEKAQPLFAAMGRLARRIGDSGSGATLKLVNNMLAFVNAVAAYEGMLLGVKAGVAPQMLHDIVQASSGASAAMRAWPKSPGVQIGAPTRE